MHFVFIPWFINRIALTTPNCFRNIDFTQEIFSIKQHFTGKLVLKNFEKLVLWENKDKYFLLTL